MAVSAKSDPLFKTVAPPEKGTRKKSGGNQKHALWCGASRTGPKFLQEVTGGAAVKSMLCRWIEEDV
jgi:hypothetical protein